MAKLEGVKSVAERIEYAGITYEKSDEPVVAGDIIRYDTQEDGWDHEITIGGYYVVDFVDEADDPQITDDVGDSFDTCGDDFTIFKAVESASTPQPSAVTTVKRKATVGDRIRIVERYSYDDPYENGAEFTVNKADDDGDVYVTCGEDDECYVLFREYEVVTETSADSGIITHEGVQYRKVARKANVGEIVVITKSDAIEVGTIAECTRNNEFSDGSIDIKYGRRVGFVDCAYESYSVLEPVTQERAIEPAASRLKVGEYARAIGPQPDALFRREGDVVKITEDDGGGRPFRCEHLDESNAGWAYVADLERISSAEVEAAREAAAKAKREADEERKWSAIGREVGEYKAGDIVGSTQFNGPAGLKAGDIATVKSVSDNGVFLTRLNPYGTDAWTAKDWIKLVTPVEQRFDRV